MTAIGKIVKGVLDYSQNKAGIDLDLRPLEGAGAYISKVVGTNYDDVIIGNSSADAILLGGNGDDTLSSVGLYTVFNGGDGNDTVDYSSSYYATNADLSTGSSMGSDTLISIENLIGAIANNTLIGNDGVNRLVGNVMGDLLDGGGGADVMIGGDGSDTYVVDHAGDQVIELADEGNNDMVQSSITYTLPDNVEYLKLIGLAALNGTGNELNNNLFGNSGANTLWGLDGNDRIRAGAGNDALLGGDGNDLLIGGIGADRLTGGSGRDVFEFESVADSKASAPDHIVDFDRGTDRIDLRDIDARLGAAGNNAFAWIGTDDFSGKEGELRYEAVGANTILQGDINGDAVADFAIHLDQFNAALRPADILF